MQRETSERVLSTRSRLIAAVTEIVGVARRTPSSWQPANTRFEAADVRSSQVAQHLRGADAVVLLTWAFQPTHQPLTTWDINVLGSMNAAPGGGRCRGRDCRLCVVVWPPIRQDLVGTWTKAGRPHSMPTAAYGREKAYLERYLDAYELRHPEIRVVRLRPCFIFKRSSASEQRRIFAGPLVPRALLRPGRLPIVPFPAGLRFQAMHGDDAGEAYRLALLSDARGAYNVATDPVIDREALGKLMEARVVQIPKQAVSAAMAGAWRLRLIPSDESLLKMFLDCRRWTVAVFALSWAGSPDIPVPTRCARLWRRWPRATGGPTPPLHSTGARRNSSE